MITCKKHKVVSDLYNPLDTDILIDFIISECCCDECSNFTQIDFTDNSISNSNITSINNNNAYFVSQRWMDIIKKQILKETKTNNYYVDITLYRNE